MKTTTEIAAAVSQLAQSERGRHACGELCRFLESAGYSLDLYNQRAVLTLVTAFFEGQSGRVLEEMEGVR